MRAVDWVPYQLPTFVTPSFPGYVSGHSTFSRAGAEVLDRVHRQRVLPGRHERLHDQGGLAQVRGKGPHDGHPARVGDVLRRLRPGRPVAAVGRHPRPRPTTSRGARSGRSAARARGRSPSATSRDRPARDRLAGRPEPPGGRAAPPGAGAAWAGAPGRRGARRAGRGAVRRARRAGRAWPARATAHGRARRAALRGRDGDRRARPHLRRRRDVLHGGRASPSSTATATAGRTCIVAGRCEPGRAVPQREHGRRGPAVRARPPTRRPTSTGVTGAYPLDVDGDGIADLAVLRVRRAEPAAWPRRLPLRARQRRAGASTGGTGWTTAFSATWEGDAALPTLAIGSYVDARRQPASRPSTAAQRARSGRRPTDASGYGPPDARWRPATARCRCCSATGTAPGAATCGSPTTATTTCDGVGAAVADARPARRRACTRPPTAGPACRSGAWASRART